MRKKRVRSEKSFNQEDLKKNRPDARKRENAKGRVTHYLLDLLDCAWEG